MTIATKIAAQLAAEIGKPQNADLIERQLVQDGRLSRALEHFKALRELEAETGCCSHCEGRGTVPPGGNHPYSDCERELCVECDGTGESA